MNPIETPDPKKTIQALCCGLTPHEIKVLKLRFSLNSKEDDLGNSIKFVPPSGGGNGQSGAPQNAIAPNPNSSTADNEKPPLNDQIIAIKKH